MYAEASARWCDHNVRLFLLQPSDVTDAYVGWLNDPLVNRYLEIRFHQSDISSVAQYVRSILASESTLLLGIESRDHGRHVGNIKIGPIDRNHGLAELGLLVGDPSAWGMGIGTSAIRLMTNIAFRELGIRKVTAGCYGSNIGSRRAFENAGYIVEGVRRQHFQFEGGVEDLILLSKFSDIGR